MRRLPAFLLLLTGLGAIPAAAHPARIVILRHAEKRDHYALCALGMRRAAALAGHYLGRAAADQAVLQGAVPAAFYSVTLHSLETIAPAAASWDMAQRTYAMPAAGLSRAGEDLLLNRATQNAARAIMTEPALDGRTVVVAWEHRHIADPRVEARYPGQRVTLRQLLHLDALANAPADWSNGNYDYFWIVDYADPRSDRPTGFRMVRQRFPAASGWLPGNVWGQADGLPAARCPGDRDDAP